MKSSARSARRKRPRSRAFALALSSLPLVACGKAPPPPVAASHEAPAAEPPPTVCPADVETLPAFPLTVAGSGDHLVPEPLAVPTRGQCAHEHTLMVQPSAAPHRGSVVRTASGTRLALHRLHEAATLPAKNLVLVAADSGLWAYDISSMARLARLVDRTVLDVAVSADGARFAYVVKDAVPEDAPREVVVVAVDGLSVVRRIPRAPGGRVRLSADGSKVVLADGDEGIHLLDVATGAVKSWKSHDTVEDAFVVPGRPSVVAYVGDDNSIAYQDFATGRAVPQSTTAGTLALSARRDLRTVIVDPATSRTYAGGEDNELRAYEGMLGEAPREVAHARLSGNVVDVACCSDGQVAAITDIAHVAWLGPNLDVTRQIGPFLPSLASTKARVALAGDRTVVSLVGRVFTWTRDGMFVEPDAFVGEEVARVEKDGVTIVVLRSRGWLEFHRFAPSDALDRESTLLGTQDWALVDSTLEGPGGTPLFVGRSHGRVVAAVIPKDGEAVFVRGPLVGVTGAPKTVARGDGKHFALWDLERRVLELDLDAKEFRVVGTIDGEPSARFDVAWQGDAWVVKDADGRARTIAAVAAPATHELTAPR